MPTCFPFPFDKMPKSRGNLSIVGKSLPRETLIKYRKPIDKNIRTAIGKVTAGKAPLKSHWYNLFVEYGWWFGCIGNSFRY